MRRHPAKIFHRAPLTERLKGTELLTASLLVITGTMGAGKTTILGEASDILALRHITHAAIDLDALGLAHLPPGAKNDGVMYRNLESLRKNYASVGVQRFLVARAIESRAELDLCRSAISAAQTVVCRLTASDEEVQRRVVMRESGIAQREYVARVAKLNAILDHARLEDFSVANENRPLSEIAYGILLKAGWIKS